MTKLILFEYTGQWASALRRELPQGVALVETRSLADLQHELEQAPSAVVGMEIAGDRVETSLAAIGQLVGKFPHAVIVALAQRRLAGYESLLREAGAAHVVFSSRQISEIAAIAGRRLAAEPDNDFNAGELNWQQQLAARLPWG
jgi:hypothetical protein